MNTKISSEIDWLQLTYFMPKRGALSALPEHELLVPTIRASALYSYEKAYALSGGGRAFFTPGDFEKGVHLQLHGEAVANLQMALGMDDHALIKLLNTGKVRKVTRFDYACDYLNGGSVDQFIAMVNNKQAKTRLKPYAIHQDWQVQTEGKTAYMGAPTSEFRLRCYDKAVELKMLWLAWTRVEAQMRDNVATVVFHACHQEGMGQAKAFVKKRFDLPECEWYQELMGAEVTTLELPRPEPKFVKWMMKQVLPAIQKRWENGEYQEEIKDFHSELSRTLMTLPDPS